MPKPSLLSSARTVWDYMLMHQPLRHHEAIFILGSRDDRVANYGAKLFLEGYGDWLIISGGVAHGADLLRPAWGDQPEAEHFAEIAQYLGVPGDKIIIENRATNTGENIRFTYQLLQARRLVFESILLVQKPYMERRTIATFAKQWPNSTSKFAVTSPPIPFDDYFNDGNPREEIWNIMVGDLQRIKEYPGLGFQTRQAIPEDVWRAYKTLVAAGYTKHLIEKPRPAHTQP